MLWLQFKTFDMQVNSFEIFAGRPCLYLELLFFLHSGDIFSLERTSRLFYYGFTEDMWKVLVCNMYNIVDHSYSNELVRRKTFRKSREEAIGWIVRVFQEHDIATATAENEEGNWKIGMLI